MNKELIKKFKAEFDHWLNNGEDSILVDIDDSFNWDSPVSYVFDTNEFNCRITNVIINDEYVEFRKALAEGKTIQANLNYWAFPETPEKQWDDIISNKIDEVFKKYGVNNIRIKPDEPKFKVGDWAKYKGTNQILQLTDKHITNDPTITPMTHNMELWKPQPNEYHWFWDSHLPHIVRFGKFIRMENNQFLVDTFDNIYETFTNCQPFIGELPTNLKDN